MRSERRCRCTRVVGNGGDLEAVIELKYYLWHNTYFEGRKHKKQKLGSMGGGSAIVKGLGICPCKGGYTFWKLNPKTELISQEAQHILPSVWLDLTWNISLNFANVHQ